MVLTAEALGSVLRRADVLLVVPPFAWTDRPALGVHLLQAVARRAGLEAQVLYANLAFAARFGERTHSGITNLKHGLFLGERLFARAAYGGPPLGRDAGAALPAKVDAVANLRAQLGRRFDFDLRKVYRLEEDLRRWLDGWTPALATRGYALVGCTSSFEQTSGALAILHAVKCLRPHTLTVMGGANCEGEMAEGILSLSARVDHVFSGESEEVFADFLAGMRRGSSSAERIIRGRPCKDLDALPSPDFTDYHEQRRVFAPDDASPGLTYLSYETSRGCWWGEKSHCTFCGLNGEGMAFRQKSPDRVVEELRGLLARSPTRHVVMTDNIMPHRYFHSLLPRLAGELGDIEIMYEQKANLSLDQVCALAQAGVREIQPGVEALSSGLLSLMAKGTTAAQNIALLRYARAAGVRLHWNLLYGFPNDRLAFYTDTLALLPLIVHLPPPHLVNQMVIDRFSPYHRQPSRYGIQALRPLPFYAEVLPEGAALEKVAYHFEGEFSSESLDQREVLRALTDEVLRWRRRYYGAEPPEVTIVARGERSFTLRDTRGLPGLPERQSLDERQAAMALLPRGAAAAAGAEAAWAIEHRLAVELDGRTVPLAVAEPSLIRGLQRRHAPSTLLDLSARAPSSGSS